MNTTTKIAHHPHENDKYESKKLEKYPSHKRRSFFGETAGKISSSTLVGLCLVDLSAQ